jgi:hypothetical protein
MEGRRPELLEALNALYASRRVAAEREPVEQSR